MPKVKQPKLIREEQNKQTSIKLIRGDISKVGGGVIVNPTNDTLSRTSGLSTFLIESAGGRVFFEMNQWKQEHESLSPGEIAVTSAGELPAIHIFHSCIPPYNRDDPEPLIRMFVLRVLEKAEEVKAGSVIIPCLPKDVFGFTPAHCSYGYFSSVIDYVNSHQDTGIVEVKFVTLDKAATAVFEAEADRKFGAKPKSSWFSFGKKKKDKKKRSEQDGGVEFR